MLVVVPPCSLLTEWWDGHSVSSTLAALRTALTMDLLLALSLLAASVAGLVAAGLLAAHAAHDR